MRKYERGKGEGKTGKKGKLLRNIEREKAGKKTTTTKTEKKRKKNYTNAKSKQEKITH